ncbi:hypothetical protein HGA34_05575 [Candidatus Falkowbacteria bacterium]|nr:hypothetical protein [Candidatus Falkowbacteria bacterium]
MMPKISIIFFIALILSGVTLYSLDRKSIISILPKSPERIIGLMLSAMSDVDTYSSRADLSLSLSLDRQVARDSILKSLFDDRPGQVLGERIYASSSPSSTPVSPRVEASPDQGLSATDEKAIIELSGKLNSKIDNADTASLRKELMADIDVKTSNDKSGLHGSSIAIGKDIYFKIDAWPSPLAKLADGSMSGKWYLSNMGQLGSSSASLDKLSRISPQEWGLFKEQVGLIITSHKLLAFTKLENERLDGHETYRIRVEIDKSRLGPALEEAAGLAAQTFAGAPGQLAEELGLPKNQAYFLQAEKVIKKIDVSLWIDAQTFRLDKLSYSLSLDFSDIEKQTTARSSDTAGPNLKLAGEIGFHNFNQPQNILAPEDFTIFKTPAIAGDSDNDGLSDLEEALYAADPFDPDSDKDGFSDGDEVSKGFDPKGPGRLASTTP